MEKKTIIKLITVLVVCVLIFCGIKIIQYISTKTRFTELKLKSDKVTKVEIIKFGTNETYVLTKDMDRWVVAQIAGMNASITLGIKYPCDPKVMTELVDKISKIKLTDIVSTNKDRYTDYQVDESSFGIIVKVYYKDSTDKPQSAFILGKSGFDYSHFYFRYPDKQEIWLSQGLERYAVDHNMDYWRDKTLVMIDKTTVESVKVSNSNGSPVNLIRKPDGWYATENKTENKVDDAGINSIIDAACAFSGDGFAGPGDKFGSTEFSIQLKTKSGTTEQLLFGSVKDGKRFVKKGSDPTLYYVYDYRANALKNLPQPYVKKLQTR
jgi:hypothetical protein